MKEKRVEMSSTSFGVTLCWCMDYEMEDMVQTVQHQLCLNKVLTINMKVRRTLKNMDDYMDQTHLILYNVPFRLANALALLEDIYQSIKWFKEFPTLGPKLKGKKVHSIEKVFIIVPSVSKPIKPAPTPKQQLASQFKPIQKGLPPPPLCLFWDESAVEQMSQSDEEWYNQWLIQKDARRPRLDVPTAEEIMMKWVKYLNIDSIWLTIACENRAAHNAKHRAEHFAVASMLSKETPHSANEKVTKSSIVKDFDYIAEACLASDMF